MKRLILIISIIAGVFLAFFMTVITVMLYFIAKPPQIHAPKPTPAPVVTTESTQAPPPKGWKRNKEGYRDKNSQARKNNEGGTDSSYPYPKRISVSHVEGYGEGIGYMTNFTTAQFLFGPDYQLGHFLPLVDIRVHRFNDNTYAGNGGIILRYLPKSFCQILGMNAYYDIRQGFKGTFQEIGFGLEILSRRWDIRGNMFFPLGQHHRVSSCLFDNYEGGYFIFNRRTEFTSYGFNAEAGWLVVNSDPFLLYWATGPYYLSGKINENTMGWQMRIRPQINDYFAIDFKASYDPVFRTVFQVEFFVTVPLYKLSSRKNKYGPCRMTDRQVYQPVERFEVIPVGRNSCWKWNF